MVRTAKMLMSFLVLGGLLLGFETGCKGSGSAGAAYQWVTIDANYQPRDQVEAFIKQDSEVRNMLPVSIINYGHDASILKRFKGSRFAGPNRGVLQMFYKGLQDWKLVDLKYLNEKKREVQRTVLYVQEEDAWKVADSGSLMK